MAPLINYLSMDSADKLQGEIPLLAFSPRGKNGENFRRDPLEDRVDI